MNKSIFSLSLILLSAVYPTFAKDDLVRLVDKDSWLVIEASNLNQLRQDLKKNPMGEIWEKSYKKFTEFSFWKELIEKENDEPLDEEDKEILQTIEELHEKLTGFYEKMNGQVVFSLGGDLRDMMLDQIEGKEVTPNAFFLAKSTTKEAELEALFEWLMEKDKELNKDRETPLFKMEEIEGVKVYFWDDFFHGLNLDEDVEKLPEIEGEENPESREIINRWKNRQKSGPNPDRRVGAFVTRGVFGICLGEQNTVELLQQIEEGSSPSSIEGIYRDAFEEIERADLNILLNASGLKDFFDFVKTNEKTQFPENPMKLTTKALLDGISFDSLETIALSMDVTEDGGSFETAMYLRDREGIWKLLNLYKEHAALPSFVPGNVFTASYSGFDLGQLWPTIENIFLNISPLMKGMMDFQIQVLEKTHNINIRKDLLGNLGDQFCTFSKPLKFDSDKSFEEAMAGREIYAVSLRNSEQFDRNLQQVLQSMLKDKLKTRSHKGTDIHYVEYIEESYISYAVTTQWLIVCIGNPSDINQVINQILEPPTDSLWSKTEVAAVLRDAPSGVVQWDYADIGNLFELLQSALNRLMEEELDVPLFQDKLPEVPYFMIGWTKDSKRGFISKATLHPKEK